MISIHLDAQTPEELLAILKKLAEDCSYGGQEVRETERPGKPVPFMPFNPLPPPVPEVLKELTEPEAQPELPKHTLADVRKVLLELVTKRGKSVAKAILETHNVKSATELTPDDFDAVILQAQAEMEAADAAN